MSTLERIVKELQSFGGCCHSFGRSIPGAALVALAWASMASLLSLKESPDTSPSPANVDEVLDTVRKARKSAELNDECPALSMWGLSENACLYFVYKRKPSLS